MSEEKNSLSESDEVRERQRKLQDLRARSIDPYPNDFRVSCSLAEFRARYESQTAETLSAAAESGKAAVYDLAGRVVGKRLMGKAAFLHLRDRSGQVQIYVKADRVGAEVFQDFKSVDLGDFLGVRGHAFRTKTNELSVDCTAVRLLSKALRPLPEKWHGLQDVETRYRQRYLDLISNDNTRKIFVARSRVIQKIREFFTARDFLEVETPMMHPIAGGAAARPFVTHHNTLDMPLYLRIAPELYLKRLVVGGLERVFEINRNFRNEGVSTQHNPEFTMIEFYQAYATYDDLMNLTEELIAGLVKDVTGGQEEISYQGTLLNFRAPWRRVTLVQSVREHLKTAADLEDLKTLQAIAKDHKLDARHAHDVGSLQALLFEELVEATLIQPTFVTQYPVAVSPLSRRNSASPNYSDRFELFVYGREIANAFSELNDPVDQRERFESQMQRREGGDEEAMVIDEDFVRALEHGMPPTAGEGIGIDRLVMLLTDAASIREVILFPLLRHEIR